MSKIVGIALFLLFLQQEHLNHCFPVLCTLICLWWTKQPMHWCNSNQKFLPAHHTHTTRLNTNHTSKHNVTPTQHPTVAGQDILLVQTDFE